MDDPLTEDNEDATKLKQTTDRIKLKRCTNQQKNRNYPCANSRQDEYTETQTKTLFREPSSAPGREMLKSETFNARQQCTNIYSQSDYYCQSGNPYNICLYCKADRHCAY